MNTLARAPGGQMRGAATKAMSVIVEERQQSRYVPFAAGPSGLRPAGFVARSSHTAPGIARRSRLASGPRGQQQSVHIISSQPLRFSPRVGHRGCDLPRGDTLEKPQMPRVKRGNKRVQRRKKILKLAKGYRLTKSKLHRSAKESVDRALRFAYRDRRAKKRDFRSLWIIRVGAAARKHDLSYSKFMSGLKKASVALDRKTLAEIAVKDPETFAQLTETAKAALAAA